MIYNDGRLNGDEITFEVNDLWRDLDRLHQRLKGNIDPKIDPRVKALILTRLEEAQLWALLLVRPQ
jgi:hypothetical protein